MSYTPEKEEKQTQLSASSITDSTLEASNVNEIPKYAGASGNLLLALITIVSTLGFTLFGYDQGVMSGIISAPIFFETFPAVDPVVQGATRASLLAGTYVSLYEIGCAAMAAFCLWKGEHFGRRKMIRIGATILMLGVIIQITCVAGHNAGAQFIIGRIVTGLGTGALTSTIPSYHSECCSPQNRGLLVAVEASMIATGTCIAYWVDYGFSKNSTSLSWRIPILLQIIFALLVLIGINFLPESPRWLALNGQVEEATRVIASLEDAPINSEVDQSQLAFSSKLKNSKKLESILQIQ